MFSFQFLISLKSTSLACFVGCISEKYLSVLITLLESTLLIVLSILLFQESNPLVLSPLLVALSLKASLLVVTTLSKSASFSSKNIMSETTKILPVFLDSATAFFQAFLISDLKASSELFFLHSFKPLLFCLFLGNPKALATSGLKSVSKSNTLLGLACLKVVLPNPGCPQTILSSEVNLTSLVCGAGLAN